MMQLRFPRLLETDHTDEKIRQALMARTEKIWSRGDIEVPVLGLSDALQKAIRDANFRGMIRCGYEGIVEQLEKERKGIAKVQRVATGQDSGRISRLILFSNDGAERFYRNIEQLLKAMAPRLLGCKLDVDSGMLGHAVTGRESLMKVVMAEHKHAVAGILKAMAAEPGTP